METATTGMSAILDQMATLATSASTTISNFISGNEFIGAFFALGLLGAIIGIFASVKNAVR